MVARYTYLLYLVDFRHFCVAFQLFSMSTVKATKKTTCLTHQLFKESAMSFD